MVDEGNANGWKVQECYILERMRDTAAIPDLARVQQPDDTSRYFFGGASIQAHESANGGRIVLESVSGLQFDGNSYKDLPMDRVYGYCTLPERHINRSAGTRAGSTHSQFLGAENARTIRSSATPRHGTALVSNKGSRSGSASQPPCSRPCGGALGASPRLSAASTDSRIRSRSTRTFFRGWSASLTSPERSARILSITSLGRRSLLK